MPKRGRAFKLWLHEAQSGVDEDQLLPQWQLQLERLICSADGEACFDHFGCSFLLLKN